MIYNQLFYFVMILLQQKKSLKFVTITLAILNVFSLFKGNKVNT